MSRTWMHPWSPDRRRHYWETNLATDNQYGWNYGGIGAKGILKMHWMVWE